MKPIPHSSHRCGAIPVCLLSCLSRFDFIEKVLLQKKQICTFSPVLICEYCALTISQSFLDEFFFGIMTEYVGFVGLGVDRSSFRSDSVVTSSSTPLDSSKHAGSLPDPISWSASIIGLSHLRPE